MKQTRKEAYESYKEKGYDCVPIPAGEKGPKLTGWPDGNIHAHEFEGEGNIGLILGAPSEGLVDVDIDVPEAIQAADLFLPETDMVHGRLGAPRSHRWYRASGTKSKKYQDIDGESLIEVRSTGMQTIVPPSVHPIGETLTYSRDGNPASTNAVTIESAVAKAAASVLLARNWPEEGSRDDAAMALAGGLARSGWSEEKIESFIRVTAVTAGDEEAEDRAKKAHRTISKLEEGSNTTGLPRLAEIIGDKVVQKMVDWLGLKLVKAPLKQNSVPSMLTADELLDMEFPHTEWIVNGLLTSGLVLIAGRPKAGKSWLALQMSLAIGSGTRFLGREVRSGAVVYLALEDNAIRLRKRMEAQHWAVGTGVTFCTELARSEQDPYGFKHIESIIKQHKPMVLIIDTASRMLANAKNNDLSDITNALGPLQHLALQEGCAILVIDHLRKGDGGGNYTDQVIGSVAKTAVADAIWCLNRDISKADGVLSITGRDFEEQEIPVIFDSSRFVWRNSNTILTEAQSEVLDCLRNSGGRSTPSEIARLIKANHGMKSLADASNVCTTLRELYDAGYIDRIEPEGRRRYYVLRKEDGIPDLFDETYEAGPVSITTTVEW
jgi:hypothetical protein